MCQCLGLLKSLGRFVARLLMAQRWQRWPWHASLARASAMKAVQGIEARRAALRLLDAVLRRGETIDQAMRAACRDLASHADQALAKALAGEAMRWLVDIDALIDSATKKRLADEAKPRMVLRLMLAGWLRLDTPPHAVVATGLPLLSGGQRRLAHGVFSTLHRQPAVLPAAPTLSAAVRERWGSAACDIAAGMAVPPRLDLTLAQPDETEKWVAELDGVSLLSGHLRIDRGRAVEGLPGYTQGAWWVQDLAASLPARLLGEGKGRRVLDLCAAPGGKTMQLAAAGWNVIALDSSSKRLKKLRANLKRVGLAAEVVQADALQWQPQDQFDAVLLDAPCTATGTCRRHPDVLHRVGAQEITKMAALQAQLLARASDWLKPGGILVYAVCSLEHDEGEAQAEGVTLQPAPINAAALMPGLKPSSQGWLRTHPGMLGEHGGLDGFFIAQWTKA